MGLKVTDPLNNSDQRSSSTSVRRDPLIFDLNMDGKVELQGGRSATPNTLQLPPGLWDINVLSTSKQSTRFFVANANQGTGNYVGAPNNKTSINAAGRWDLGIERNAIWTVRLGRL